MPNLKINIGNKDYSISCEDGEEEDLKKAVNIVNEKMNLFKDEKDIPLIRKFLMTSILIANDLSHINQNEKNETVKKEIDELFVKIEKLLDI